MDQDAFRQTYRDINDRLCVFEKSILTNQCRCSRAERLCIAEREGVHCTSDEAQALCIALLDMLREQSRFALKNVDGQPLLAHGKAMRIQVGGLRGLYSALYPDQPIPHPIPDINGLIEAAVNRFSGIDGLPLQPVIQQIAAYRGKVRGRRKR
ncbi:MAG TPA: hypothetical protein EYH03_02025 [Chromatiales bacterium]|nr:hypothetical protein [Chromatiales bacterium]